MSHAGPSLDRARYFHRAQSRHGRSDLEAKMSRVILVLVAVLLLVGSPALANGHRPPPVAPPPPVEAAPPPVEAGPPAEALGWVYGPYTSCADPSCGMLIVNVVVDGINVRSFPDGPIILTVGNGTPLFVLQRQG